MLTVFSIYQYVKDKLEKTEEGTSAYNALWDVYQFIRVNMNSSYGATTETKMSDQEIDETLDLVRSLFIPQPHDENNKQSGVKENE